MGSAWWVALALGASAVALARPGPGERCRAYFSAYEGAGNADVRPVLYATLRENPESLEARRQLADVLTDGGDSRGELIAIELELEAGGVPPERLGELTARRQVLRGEAEARLATMGVERVVWYRGTVDAIHGALPADGRHAVALAEECPLLRRVTVAATSPAPLAAAAISLLEGVAHRALPEAGYGAEVAGGLFYRHVVRLTSAALPAGGLELSASLAREAVHAADAAGNAVRGIPGVPFGVYDAAGGLRAIVVTGDDGVALVPAAAIRSGEDPTVRVFRR